MTHLPPPVQYAAWRRRLPPPASAASKWVSSQTVTTPPACAGLGADAPDANSAKTSQTESIHRCVDMANLLFV
ncbi:MAG TPA: hypothetical protein VL334_10290 [Anaerolineae bacterium]|nr:hypothetical protein [Anaerolineae bacterium]